MSKILIIQDEEPIRRVLVWILKDEDSSFEIHEASDGKKGLDLIKNDSYDLVLCDININDKNNKIVLIEPAEVIKATMYVKNNGQQVAKDVSLEVLFGDFVFNTGKSSFNLGNIKKDQKKKVQFSFFAMSEAEKELPISFEIKESRSKFDQIVPSGLDLNRNNKVQN